MGETKVKRLGKSIVFKASREEGDLESRVFEVKERVLNRRIPNS